MEKRRHRGESKCKGPGAYVAGIQGIRDGLWGLTTEMTSSDSVLATGSL